MGIGTDTDSPNIMQEEIRPKLLQVLSIGRQRQETRDWQMEAGQSEWEFPQWNQTHVFSTFQHCDKVPDTISLKEGMCILAHCFRQQFLGAIAFDDVVRQHTCVGALSGGSCSPHENTEVKTEIEEEARIPELMPGKISLRKILPSSSSLTGLRTNL